MNPTNSSRKTRRHYRLLSKLSDELIKIAEGSDSFLTTRAPDVSGWSVAEHLDHLAESNLAIVEGLMGGLSAPPKQPASRLRLVGRLVLLTGFIPRGVGVAPERSRPRGGSVDEVRARLAEAGARVSGLEVRLPEVEQAEWRFDHPYFGGLNPRMWLRFTVIHTRHHLKIIADIEDALAGPAGHGVTGRPADGEEQSVV